MSCVHRGGKSRTCAFRGSCRIWRREKLFPSQAQLVPQFPVIARKSCRWRLLAAVDTGEQMSVINTDTKGRFLIPMSFIFITNNCGPQTEPCGTPTDIRIYLREQQHIQLDDSPQTQRPWRSGTFINDRHDNHNGVSVWIFHWEPLFLHFYQPEPQKHLNRRHF